jgi:hypothetical protein
MLQKLELSDNIQFQQSGYFSGVAWAKIMPVPKKILAKS